MPPPAAPDTTSDFNNPAIAPPSNDIPANTTAMTQPTAPATTPRPGRTLLLAPPSLAAREDRLSALFALHPRATTDLHMLDRLAAGLVALPAATYDLVLVLTDTENGGTAPAQLRDRAVWSRLVPAIRPGGKVRGEDDGALTWEGEVVREAVLAGLVRAAGGGGEKAGFEKPEYAEEEVVMLRFGGNKNKKNGEEKEVPAVPSAAAPRAPQAPAGVGFIDFSDDLDLDAEDDDDVIDEETLLTEEDLRRPIQQPPECQPQPGKKRRACKDCTCGLAQRLEAEDKARRAKADKDLNTLKLKSEDLNELDFTVQGKTGSCGSCYLGDAFRCADCPYIGLPAFKPGEEVRILNNTAQL
ncbi:hypothetical protein VTK26DRAFT_4222 [Humicola hyalothermophila]